MVNYNTIINILLASSISALCIDSDSNPVPKGTSMPLRQVSVTPPIGAKIATSVVVTGEIYIVDQCRFQLRNFKVSGLSADLKV